MDKLDSFVYKRKSTRKFKQQTISDNILEQIENFINTTSKISDDAKFMFKLIDDEKMPTIKPFKAPYYLSLYSEDTELSRMNIGFIIGKLDLYLHSIGLASCWLGAVSPVKLVKEDSVAVNNNLQYQICFAFGYPKDEKPLHNRNFDASRKKLSEICSPTDKRLNVCRVSASAMNSQPWYFLSDNDFVFVYRKQLTLIKKTLLDEKNQIDMGIALANLSVSYPETFEFFMTKSPKEIEGYSYVGTVKI